MYVTLAHNSYTNSPLVFCIYLKNDSSPLVTDYVEFFISGQMNEVFISKKSSSDLLNFFTLT